ncbi:energy transducer TonB family protein [Magnetospirillum aberrantis]|uniref:Protein TonB n=1 Tax=Magnetospirillum aberrantis SpK TaxID=908842 RepID=A0A7C9QS41_9PROT|nr:energy transducer TonB [Magnetospirillum aberrantis]NFV78839.1 energy transducer TonB [Magnetospirillum aberrantis SpK]
MRGKSDVHPGAPWRSATAVATMLHGGALAAAVLWHASAPPPPPAPPAAMMIELAPMAAPAAPTDKAPGIEQEAARPIEKAVQEPPKPEPVKKAEVPLPRPKPRPKPRPAPPVEAPPAEKVVEQTTAPAAAEAPTAQKTAAPTLGSLSAAPSNAVPTWQGALRAHLERHKRYPSAAQFRRQEGVAYVRFSMKRDGSVLSARLERASGFSRLDDEALALLDRAQPLPLPPPEVMGEVIDIVVPIQFFLRSTGS